MRRGDYSWRRASAGPARTARRAGLGRVRVERPDLEGFAIRAGVPVEAMPLLRGGFGGQLLLARKG